MAIALFASLLLLIASGFSEIPAVACFIPITIYFFVIPFATNVYYKLCEISDNTEHNARGCGRRIMWDYKTQSMSCDKRDKEG